MSLNNQSTPQPRPSSFGIVSSPYFVEWLAQEQLSLAFTTYQAGKLFLVGRSASDRLSVFERTFDRAMGLWSDGQSMWLAAAFQLWQFHNVFDSHEVVDGYDRLYVPRAGYTTGDLDIHDISVDGAGRIVFVNTLFSCLGVLSDVLNFTPLWRPHFISKLAAEDRCHLNGLAMQAGRPAYVTACSQGDSVNEWRHQRATAGCVIDVAANATVMSGLAMPHSPRVYDGELWLLNSGSGYLGKVDVARGKFEPVAFCPGYARGLAFHGRFAIVGLSKPRESTFSGLPLEQNLTRHGIKAETGIQVIDIHSGKVAHWLRAEGPIHELYDVALLPGVTRPRALGFKTDEVRHNIWLDDNSRRVRWSAPAPPG